MKKNIFLSCMCLLSLSIIKPFPGVLDPTFGLGTGIVTTSIGDVDTALAIAIQRDGKIVVAGQAIIGGNTDFALARYNLDGTLDTTFNAGGSLPGTVTTVIGTSNIASGIAIQEDGKIVAAGRADDTFAVARYNPDGTLDTTFNASGSLPGTVTTTIGIESEADAIVIQKNGKIVVAGRASDGIRGNFAVARYNRNGTLDTSFNPTGSLPGTVTTTIDNIDSEIRSIALQPCDGKIVAAGRTDNGINFTFTLARYNTNGTLDTSFNSTGSQPGTLMTAIGTDGQAFGVVIQQDGKIVAAGSADIAGTQDFVVARYTTDGILDTTFNSGGLQPGVVTTDFSGGFDRAESVVIQADGKIVAAGIGNDNEIAVARYTIDGALDTSFNPTGPLPGTVTTTIGEGAQAFGVALQEDGKIVTAGTALIGANEDFILTRYLNEALVVTKEALTENPCPGQNITYTITVTNTGAGGGTVNGIFLEDVLPTALIFRSAQTSGEASSFDPLTGIWNIPYLRVGKQAQLIIKARVGQFAGNQVICNTAITTYSSVDEVTNSSLFDTLGISTTEIFSTIECVSTSPVIYENLNHIVDRIDCGIDDAQMDLNVLNEQVIRIDAKSAELNDKLNIALLKLNNVIELFFPSEVDCLFP